MIATIALIAATLFVVVALYRFVPSAPPALVRLAAALALTAGVFAIGHWRGVEDSRWAVAGALMFGALAGSVIGRPLRVAGILFGMAALALMGIATISPKATPPSAVPAGS